jgi:hypothetical protein
MPIVIPASKNEASDTIKKLIEMKQRRQATPATDKQIAMIKILRPNVDDELLKNLTSPQASQLITAIGKTKKGNKRARTDGASSAATSEPSNGPRETGNEAEAGWTAILSIRQQCTSEHNTSVCFFSALLIAQHITKHQPRPTARWTTTRQNTLPDRRVTR